MEIRANDLGYSIPSGKIPLGCNILQVDTSAVMIYYTNLGATGTGIVAKLRNITNNSVTTIFTIRITFSDYA